MLQDRLKDLVKESQKKKLDVVDVTAEGQDFVDVTICSCKRRQKRSNGIVDYLLYGAIHYGSKSKEMVAAVKFQMNRSAYWSGTKT